MTDQLLLHGVLDQRLVQTARQGALSEPGKGTREGRLAGHRPHTLPAAQAAQRPVVGQPFKQCPGSVDLEHRLGDEGARQRHTILLRATAQGAKTGQMLFHPHQLEHGDEQLVAFPQGTEVCLDCREQVLLKRAPVTR